MTEDDIKKFVKEKVPEVSAKEYNNAWLVIISQEKSLRLKERDVKKLVHAKISVKLATYNWTVKLVVLGGRMSNFPVGFRSDEKIPRKASQGHGHCGGCGQEGCLDCEG